MNRLLRISLHLTLAFGLLVSRPIPLLAAGRFNTVITITAGTPVQLAAQPMPVDRIFIQMAVGGSGVGYVMDGIQVGVTPNHSTAGQLTAQLAAATASTPGGAYSDSGPNIDLQKIWIDGAHTGDTVLVSYSTRN